MPYNNQQYWNNLVGAKMNLREVGWPQWTEAFNDARYKLCAEQTIKSLNQLFSTPPKTILEIGCGIGFWTNVLTQLYPNADYVGIDISKNAVANLQATYSTNNNIKIVCADIGSVEIDDIKSQYDLVICMEVLLHITSDDDWQSAIKNILHLSGNYTIISDPFLMWQGNVQNGFDNNKVRTWHEYQQAIEQANCKVVSITPRTFLLDNNIDFKTTFGLYTWNLFFKVWHRILKIKNENLGKWLGKFAYNFDKWYCTKTKYGHGCRQIVVQKNKG